MMLRTHPRRNRTLRRIRHTSVTDKCQFTYAVIRSYQKYMSNGIMFVYCVWVFVRARIHSRCHMNMRESPYFYTEINIQWDDVMLSCHKRSGIHIWLYVCAVTWTTYVKYVQRTQHAEYTDNTCSLHTCVLRAPYCRVCIKCVLMYIIVVVKTL